jgi:hypothetical protein
MKRIKIKSSALNNIASEILAMNERLFLAGTRVSLGGKSVFFKEDTLLQKGEEKPRPISSRRDLQDPLALIRAAKGLD